MRDERDDQGRLIGVRFVYRGRDVAAVLDLVRGAGRVSSGGRHVGVLAAAEGATASAVARAIVDGCLRRGRQNE